MIKAYMNLLAGVMQGQTVSMVGHKYLHRQWRRKNVEIGSSRWKDFPSPEIRMA